MKIVSLFEVRNLNLGVNSQSSEDMVRIASQRRKSYLKVQLIYMISPKQKIK